MKTWMGLVAAVLGLIGSASVSGGDKGADVTVHMYHIELRVTEYDQDGKIKERHEPTVTTVEGCPCSFLVGGEVAIPTEDKKVEFLETGDSLRMSMQSVGGGKVRLDATAQNSWLEPAPKPKLHLRSNTLRTIETVRLGEPLLVELENGPDDGGGRVFEITVREGDKADQ